MPAFTVSAVDTTANTFTSTGVAAAGQPEGAVLLTGDRFRLRNVGGALPASTPALAVTTDYWARRVDDNTIQAYDSNAHAIAGGGTGLFDLTGSGSGTTTIEFGLPYALPTVIAGPGVQARSSIFNAMYNALVALYDLLTGQSQSVWSSVKIAVPLTAAAPTRTLILGPAAFQLEAGGASPTYSPGSLSLTSSNAPIACANIDLPSGKQINTIRYYIRDQTTGAVALTGSLATNDGSGTITTVGSSNTSAHNSTDQVLTLSGLTTTIAAGTGYSVRVSANATGAVEIYKAEIDYIE